MPLKTKTTKRRTLIKKLDKIWSVKIKERDIFCRKCGKTKSTQAAHIFSRNNMSVRWDLDNGLGMCYYCHIYWAHREPVEFTEWVKSILGIRKFNSLKRKASKIKQWSEKELEKLLKTYEQR